MTTLSIKVVVLPITDIVNSPLNPRGHSPWQFTKDSLQPLADAMTAAKNMAFITVRPHPKLPGKYELADGERRWRAAPLAGVATLQAIVKDLTDAEMLDIMLGGGANQEPLSPMAEAHGYRERMDLGGLTQQDLAMQLGVSDDTISRRLALLDLPKDGQKAVDEGRLDASTAYLIATLPDAGGRAAFAAEVMHPELQDQPLSARAAAALRSAKYCRSLRGVPFDTKDALLVPAMGSCTHCRFKENTHCANIPCFDDKVAAARAKVVGEYRKRGIEPLTADENSKAFPHGEDGLSYKVDLVEYAKPVPRHLLKTEITAVPKWPDICHGAKAKLQVRVGFDQAGRPVELVKVGEAVCAADLNEQQIFNEETRVRFGLENQAARGSRRTEDRGQTTEGGSKPQAPDKEHYFDPQEQADNDLVDRFAAAMKLKLEAARDDGKSGWQEGDWMDSCRKQLVAHVAKGDPLDVANFCAFLWHHGESTSVKPDASPEHLAEWVKAHNLGMAPEKIAESYGADIEDVCGALGVPVPEAVA